MWLSPKYPNDDQVFEKSIDFYFTDEQFEDAILHMWDHKSNGIFFTVMQGFFTREEYETIPKILKIIKDKRNCEIKITFKDK